MHIKLQVAESFCSGKEYYKLSLRCFCGRARKHTVC